MDDRYELPLMAIVVDRYTLLLGRIVEAAPRSVKLQSQWQGTQKRLAQCAGCGYNRSNSWKGGATCTS